MDPFENQYLPGQNDFLRPVVAAVLCVVVGLPRDSAAPHQLLHILQQQVMVENVRFVIVQLAPLFKGQVWVVPIIGVLLKHQAAVRPQPLFQRMGQG